MPLTSISHVIIKLDYIINWSKIHNSKLGYFPAIYQRTTIEVERAIDSGFFNFPEKVRELDIRFAEYYIKAFEQYMRGQKPSESRFVAFEAVKDNRLSVMQHIMLGMNAHINLDLGLVTADLFSPEELPGIKNDFFKVNSILFSLVDEMQNQISSFWGALKYIDQYLGRLDEKFSNYVMRKMRDRAWRVAEEIANSPEQEQQLKIAKFDLIAANAGRKIVSNQSKFFNPVLYVIRKSEQGEQQFLYFYSNLSKLILFLFFLALFKSHTTVLSLRL
jgi:hypothetical protein